MNNQGRSTDTIAEPYPNALEKCQIVDSSGQASASASLTPGHSLLPSATGSTTVSWTLHMPDYSSSGNGHISSSSYHHNQQTEPFSREVQYGLNAPSNASTSSNLEAANGPPEYAGNSSYMSSTDANGYGNTGYQHGYYYHYPQQTTHSYTEQGGVYEHSGALYQPLTSFQNTGPASYTSTYYNAADYQTTGGYPSNEYNQTTGGYPSNAYDSQTNLWNQGSYAHYSSHQYSPYTSSDSNGAPSSSTVAAAPPHYQQQYKPWADYYSQTDVSCAPGTQDISVNSVATSGCAVSGGTGAFPFSNGQPPPPGTTSWRPEPSSSELPSLQQAGTITRDAHNVYWKNGASGIQNHINPLSYFQKPLDPNPLPYDSSQDQQKVACPQGSNLQCPIISQVPQSQIPQNHQPPLQTFPSLDTHRVSKLQIPTNPRIASNLGLSLPKTNKDSSTTNAATLPAYISVSMLKSNNNVPSHDAADSMLKPGMFPASLRAYVERALARCKDDSQKAACQNIMKDMITKTSADGTLFTKDWDTEPLFPLPDMDTVNKDSGQSSGAVSSLPKYKRSPSRRNKSRWEPISEEKLVEKLVSVSHVLVKELSSGKCESEDDDWNNSKLPSLQQQIPIKSAQGPVKKQRLGDTVGAAENGGASSDSDKEQGLTTYYSSAITLANSPEERKRRENRFKRFEAHGHRAHFKHFRQKAIGAGSLSSRRASVLELSRSYEDGGSRAVEDIDWDSLTVKGTSQEIEKHYLRLTSAPDPATVRPEEVLEKALLMVQNSQKNYLYKCDQLKSIRQDLTVQRICNQLTVKVYETHARLALEAGDLAEYNQCQSQLKSLYAEGIKGCQLEFYAYNLLCIILHSNNNRDLLSSMARLSDEAKKDDAVKHALAVRAAVTLGNHVLFFRLYKMAPNLNTCLMDLYVEKMRFEAVRCMSRSYRPTLPVAYIAQVLGFMTVWPTTEGNEEKDMDGLEECEEWLRAHGACLITDNSGEMQLDTKASSSSLYMPEPEDAVAHGDTNLAVNDFLTRTS